MIEELEVEGEILTNDGRRALVAQFHTDGSMKLIIYEVPSDTRFNAPLGQWIYLTLLERKALLKALNLKVIEI